jgi:hypothetical protein
MKRLLPLFALSAILAAVPVAAQTMHWYKGNTHTHTLNSDGDSTPAEAVTWYREHGYNFLFLTDHEYINNVDALNGVYGKPGSFVVLSGQEVTDGYEKRAYHSNSLGAASLVMPNRLPGVQTLQKNIDDIVKAGGVAQVNHPNFLWSLSADDLIKLQNYTLLEIHNGHFLVNNEGGGGVPSAEEMWDRVLTSGKLVFAVADDDAHSFKRAGDPLSANPGQGWIYVRAASLDLKAILDALRKGDFYASTGVELADYQAGPKQITVTVKEDQWSKYRIQFIGSGGRVLGESVTSPASYTIKGDEGYVRARILGSNGKRAWTQPVVVGKGS